MTQGAEGALCALESLLPRLEHTADITASLEALSELPGLLASLQAEIDRFFDTPLTFHTHKARTLLSELQTALTMVGTRLESERNSLGLQLRELTAQEEWVRASRQIT